MILSYKDINEIANKIIKQYENAIGKPVYNVNIVDLLRRLYGVEVEFYQLSRTQEVLGLASPTNLMIEVLHNGKPMYVEIGSQLVLVDTSLLEDNMLGRRNFTIAHEGSHQILFRMEPNKEALHLRKTCKGDAERRLVTQIDWEEWQIL